MIHILGEENFSGKDSITVARFFAGYKEKCNNLDVPEGIAKNLLKSFFTSPAKVASSDAQHNDPVDKHSVGINSYCDSIQLLLRTYAEVL